MAGRYFQFQLHPFDLWEATNYFNIEKEKAFDALWHCGGFPEPFLKNNKTFYQRWRRSHLDIILRQDLIDSYLVRDIKAIETLITLLRERVGSPVSYASLGRDLERDINTIKRWLQMLENLYVIFRITPHHKNIARSLLKEPKFYFYDHAYIQHDDAAHFENIVASALLKQSHYIKDTTGADIKLHYLRTKDGREIDFAITMDNIITHLIETKPSDDNPSKHFSHFLKYVSLKKEVKAIQLVKNLDREKTTNTGIEIRKGVNWLSDEIANLNEN